MNMMTRQEFHAMVRSAIVDHVNAGTVCGCCGIAEMGGIDDAVREIATRIFGPAPRKTVRIPGRDAHEGWDSIEVTVTWECPTCGHPRGDVFDTISYDGSRRLGVHGWRNPCGHIDTYSAVRREAERSGAS
jgi:hypothetical protein